MRRLELDFQPRRTGLGAWALLLAGASLVLGATLLQQGFGQQQEALEQQLQQVERQLGKRPEAVTSLTPAQSREQTEKLAQMRSVSQQLQRPWERLFNMLEGLPQDDVALLTLTPDARKGQVRISAEARDLEAMLAFHKRLEASGELRDVSLLNHEIVAKQPEHPVQFNLSATWEIGNAHP
ncbi:pilus assembly protein [Pseudomonas sp. JQ170]|uniref:PilN domain-containing protein n=1 Tax=unclassified Pseudomonas TaxID=196821 RepID=UPI00264A81D5|nr:MULTISPECIES: PilN domain-containing protein [unclassified Pseudomonas]MDN7140009.1 pilus assembly protein [Pseudomonas sp. JQ170]WRO78630.1 PilN domain-containing protein [Pseudomonas sp. 170C]